MTLSPLDRLSWLLQVTKVQPPLPAGTLRIAIWLAEQARDGRMVDSFDSIAEKVGVSYNTVDRALDALLGLRFLVIERKATQRQHGHYAMVRVPKAGDSEKCSGSPHLGTLAPSRVPSPGNQSPQTGSPESPNRAPRVPRDGERQEGARGLEEAEEGKQPPPLPEDAFAKADQSAAPKRRHTLGDLEACHSVLIVWRDDRDTAETLLTLYGWDACNRGISELTPAAKARQHGKQRVTIGELRTWLGARFELDPQDYHRAGLSMPAPTAKATP